MSVTRNRIKIKQPNKHNTEPNSYISYFQSVITIGVVSRGDSVEDAERQSRAKMDSSKFTSGIINQTPFEISETEPWSPGFADKPKYDFSEQTRKVISERLTIPLSELTSKDCARYLEEFFNPN